MTRLTALLLLTIIYFSTILLEIWLNFFRQTSSKITLLQHIQMSITSTFSISIILTGSVIFIVLMKLLKSESVRAKVILYVTLRKFFKLLPVLVDLINILFIYHYQNKSIYEMNFDSKPKTFNLSTHLKLRIILASIRFLLNIDIFRRKWNTRSNQQIIFLFDFLLYILVSASTIHYSTEYLVRIARKFIVGFLLVQSNNLFYNENFWNSSITRNNNRRQFNSRTLFKTIYLILFIRWIISLFIICLATCYAFQSICTNDYGISSLIRNSFIFFYYYIYNETVRIE